MKNQAINYVNFNGEPVPTVLHKGEPHVGMKAICEQMGLNWDSQFRRIKRDELLNSVIAMMAITGKDGKTYQMIVLPLKMLNGWLFGIDTARIKNDIKQTIIDYQRECYEVLYSYWNGKGKQNQSGSKRELIALIKSLPTIKDTNIRTAVEKMVKDELAVMGYPVENPQQNLPI